MISPRDPHEAQALRGVVNDVVMHVIYAFNLHETRDRRTTKRRAAVSASK